MKFYYSVTILKNENNYYNFAKSNFRINFL